MEVKAAFNKMKTSPGTQLHFFYCEQGSDGKPVLLIDTKAIAKDAQDEALSKAKKKGKAVGLMEMNKNGDLSVLPKGSAATSLAKGVQIAARNNNCMPTSIGIGPGTTDGDEKSGKGPELGKLDEQQKKLVQTVKDATAKYKNPQVQPLIKNVAVKVSEAGVYIRKKEGAPAHELLQEANKLLQTAMLKIKELGDEAEAGPVKKTQEEPKDKGPKDGNGYNAAKGIYEGRPKKPSSLKGVDEVGDSETAHHLYPWNKICAEINKALQGQSKDQMKKLLKFGKCEGEVASWFLDNVALPPDQRHVDFGKEVDKAAQAICWSPGNIFMGPLNNKRGDDPGEKIDTAYTKSGLPTPNSAVAALRAKKGGIAGDNPLAERLAENIEEAGQDKKREYDKREWTDNKDGKRVARKKVPIKEEGGEMLESEDTEWVPQKGPVGKEPKTPKEPKAPSLSKEEIEQRRKEAAERLKEKQQAKDDDQSDEEETQDVDSLFG